MPKISAFCGVYVYVQARRRRLVARLHVDAAGGIAEELRDLFGRRSDLVFRAGKRVEDRRAAPAAAVAGHLEIRARYEVGELAYLVDDLVRVVAAFRKRLRVEPRRSCRRSRCPSPAGLRPTVELTDLIPSTFMMPCFEGAHVFPRGLDRRSRRIRHRHRDLAGLHLRHEVEVDGAQQRQRDRQDAGSAKVAIVRRAARAGGVEPANEDAAAHSGLCRPPAGACSAWREWPLGETDVSGSRSVSSGTRRRSRNRPRARSPASARIMTLRAIVVMPAPAASVSELSTSTTQTKTTKSPCSSAYGSASVRYQSRIRSYRWTNKLSTRTAAIMIGMIWRSSGSGHGIKNATSAAAQSRR